MDVYKEYDENRLALVEELKQMMKDCMVDNDSARIIKRLEPIDIEFLDLMNLQGTLDKNWLQIKHPELKEILKKAKARSLAIPVKKFGTEAAYCYDLTDLGFETLKIIKQTRTPEQESEKVKALKEKYGL
jgi:hypothetical protein